MSTISAGKAGEEAALKLLKRKGYKILARNFSSRFGEIDIVAQDPSAGPSTSSSLSLGVEDLSSGPKGSGQGTLVFVEVKTRWSPKFGPPEEAVTPRKLRSIVKTGQYFKLTHPQTPDLMRVDVVAVEASGNKVISAKIIKNATE